VVLEQLVKEGVIEGFKGVEEGRVELRPLTILVGANNSGKSTVLEALMLGAGPTRRVPYVIDVGRASALDVVRSLHATLEASGHAFLLRNYTSQRGLIALDLGHRVVATLFRLLEDKIGVYHPIVASSVEEARNEVL